MRKIFAIIVCCVCCGMNVKAQPAYTLQQLKGSALQNNAAIRNAQLSIKTSQQQRKEAFTKYFPNVSATGL